MNPPVMNRDRTNCSDIWKWWGGAYAPDNIVENRNRFAIEYNLSIKQNRDYPLKLDLYNPSKFFSSCFDHREYYKTRDGKWVILNSPYDNSRDAEENTRRDMKLACLGFKKIYSLYHPGTSGSTTYVRVIDDARSHRWDYDQAERVYEAMKALEKFC